MPDVTELLMQDHRTVEDLFSEYEQDEDANVLDQICRALEVHTTVEEEVVYPRLAALDAELEREAQKEHAQAKDLIAQIRAGDPDAAALAHQLKQAVEHHVQEEETTLFPLMQRELGAELEQLGREASSRKEQLLAGSP
jgi:hemerythrin superfamily protein